MYTLKAETDLPRLDLDFAGYRRSQPVRIGNDAQSQLQLGGYADILDAAYRFCGAGHVLDPRSADQCATLADAVCELWQRDDSGIWEVDEHPYTQSKIACWAALDHAIELAENGRLPDRHVKTWRRDRAKITRAPPELKCIPETGLRSQFSSPAGRRPPNRAGGARA